MGDYRQIKNGGFGNGGLWAIRERAIRERGIMGESGIARTGKNIFMYSNVIGFDDAPFSRSHRGDVPIVGTVYAGLRFDGILVGSIRKDGANAAKKITRLISESKFAGHIRLIMLQGVAMGGFNVVDAEFIYRRLNLPVLIVSRRKPDMKGIRDALLGSVPGGQRKWRLIKSLGPMAPVRGVFVQRVGLNLKEANDAIEKFAINGNIPEPLRTAHLIAGGIVTGSSRGRV